MALDNCVLPESDEVLTNTANTLKEIEQSEVASSDQCSIFRKEFKSRKSGNGKLTDLEYNRSVVLCGKWMFINLGMKTNIGIPTALLKSIQQFDEVGPKLKNLGFHSDASWDEKDWPFGIVDTSHQNPLSLKRVSVNSVKQISCAACHTGKLSDGRYSLGAANENLEYGKFNLYSLFSIWMVDKDRLDPKKWHPDLIKKYETLSKINTSSFLKNLTAISKVPVNNIILKYLIGEEAPPLETQLSFLNSQTGIYNGFAPSLNFKDRQYYISAPQLYEVGTEKEAHYGSLAGHENIDNFILEAFVYSTSSKKYNKEIYIKPIKEFLKCLKAPKIQKPIDKDLYSSGKEIFTASCTKCHNLQNGGGSGTVPQEVINTPAQYLQIFNNYEPKDIQSKRTLKLLEKLSLVTTTKEVKVRRLKGIWTRSKLSINGQLEGLDQMFCLNSTLRKDLSQSTRTQQIHSDLCNDYSTEEKLSLKEYLLHF
jgi:hypothetical protein